MKNLFHKDRFMELSELSAFRQINSQPFLGNYITEKSFSSKRSGQKQEGIYSRISFIYVINYSVK